MSTTNNPYSSLCSSKQTILQVAQTMNGFITNDPFASLDDNTKRAFNLMVGINQTELFFKNPSRASAIFSQSLFENFWSGNIDYTEFNTVINSNKSVFFLVGNFFRDLVDSPNFLEVSNNLNDNILTQLYTKFLNPYTNFIIDKLFCDLPQEYALNFSQNSQNITSSYFENLYLFIKGVSVGDDTGNRGSGTLRICQYCQVDIDKAGAVNKDNVFSSLNTTSNTYYKNFCGCCSVLNNYYPNSYNNVNSDVKPTLDCLPICHQPEVVKAFNGNDQAVNNGFPDNKNPNPIDNQVYTRRSCLGQTVCVIDNVSINIKGGNSQVEFNQVCPGCTGTNLCLCYVDFSGGGTLDSINDGTNGFQNNVIVKNNCQQTFCQKTVLNNDGQPKTVTQPCNSSNTSDTPKSNNSQYNHDGQPTSNSTVSNNIKYIFGIQNWLFPTLMFLIFSLVIICLLVVNVNNYRREIYFLKEKGVN